MSVTIFDRINAAVAISPIGTWFRLEGCGHPRERVGSRFLVSRNEMFTLKAILNFPRPKSVLASQPGYVNRAVPVAPSSN